MMDTQKKYKLALRVSGLLPLFLLYFALAISAEIQQTAIKTITVILIMRVGVIAFPLSDGPLIFL